MKVPGGRPAIAKKVSADLDSDDDTIMRMKNAKFLEKDIAQHLVNEGRIAYNPKTIGTRHARIMRAQQKRQDEQLDAELTDWHDGDVSLYLPVYTSTLTAHRTMHWMRLLFKPTWR
jgi:hypothetical protein